MPCKLKVIASVVDRSRIEYFCDGNSEAYDAVAQFDCEIGDHSEIWSHDQIALPAIKSRVLSASCLSFAIDGTVRLLSSDETTVKVIARITPPEGEPTEHAVCAVVGKNTTVEFPRLLILMAGK